MSRVEVEAFGWFDAVGEIRVAKSRFRAEFHQRLEYFLPSRAEIGCQSGLTRHNGGLNRRFQITTCIKRGLKGVKCVARRGKSGGGDFFFIWRAVSRLETFFAGCRAVSKGSVRQRVIRPGTIGKFAIHRAIRSQVTCSQVVGAQVIGAAFNVSFAIARSIATCCQTAVATAFAVATGAALIAGRALAIIATAATATFIAAATAVIIAGRTA